MCGLLGPYRLITRSVPSTKHLIESKFHNRDMRRRHIHLVCLNIPGMLMSLGQPSKAKQAATLVQVRFKRSSLLSRLQGRLWSSLTGADSTFCMQNGMRSFRKGDVAGSIQAFDEALRLDPAIRPYLWQRGLSLYYAGNPPRAMLSRCAHPSLHKVSQHSCIDHIGQVRASDVYSASQAVQCAAPPHWSAAHCSHIVCIRSPLCKRGPVAKVQAAEV